MAEFELHIRKKEVTERTIKQYRRDIERFINYTGENVELEKEIVCSYKEKLLKKYKPVTVVAYLITVNRILKWAGLGECCVGLPHIQKRYSLERPMAEKDYRKLLDYAKANKKWKYYCIMRTLAVTGIRVGELHFITYESLKAKKACVTSKNKIREIYLTDELIDILERYAAHCGIESGPLFVGRTPGKPIDTSAVWKGLKRMAKKSSVAQELVFPHNFRHLFARTYMKIIGNITELADMLGHSSLETTRIYTKGTMEEKRSSLSLLGL